MRPEKGLPKFRETKYPHRRSEGQSKRWNRGLRELEEIRVKYEDEQEDVASLLAEVLELADSEVEARIPDDELDRRRDEIKHEETNDTPSSHRLG